MLQPDYLSHIFYAAARFVERFKHEALLLNTAQSQ